MTTTIAETRIRAQVQEYDGVAYVYIETRTATAWEWKRVATFSHDSQHEALEWAREAGWAWLLGAEPQEPDADETDPTACTCGDGFCDGCDRADR